MAAITGDQIIATYFIPPPHEVEFRDYVDLIQQWEGMHELKAVVELASSWYATIFGRYWEQDDDLDHERVVQWFGELECACRLAEDAVAQAVQELDDALDDIDREYWHYRERFAEDLVARLAETFGGAELPDSARFIRARNHISEIRGQGRARQFWSAGANAAYVREELEGLAQDWTRFCEDALAGAQLAVTIGSATRTVSFAVLTGLATGGLTAYLGATSTIGKLVISGAVATGTKFVEGTATQAGEVLAGSRGSFALDEAAGQAFKAGISQMIGTLGGRFVEGMAGRLAVRFVDPVAGWAGNAVAQVVRRSVETVVEESAGTLLQAAAEVTIQAMLGREFSSTEELADAVWDEFCARWGENLIQGAMGKLAQHGGKPLTPDLADQAVRDAFAAVFGR